MGYTTAFPRPGAHIAQVPLDPAACTTWEEHEAAVEKCAAETVLRGFGQDNILVQGGIEARVYAYDSTRWRNVPPCAVAELPVCGCASDLQAYAVANCLAGTIPQGWTGQQADSWCAQVGGGLVASQWCPGNQIPPVPGCFQAGERDIVNYCSQHGYQGPNAVYNSLCYSAIRAGLLGLLAQVPSCGGPSYDAPPPPPVTQPPPPPVTTAPTTTRSGMMLPGLILLLVAAGGTAYYVAQRKRK